MREVWGDLETRLAGSVRRLGVVMTPRQRLRQSKVKMRLIGAREMRDWLAGKMDILPECGAERVALDAIAQAYAAGFHDGQNAGRDA